MQFRVLFVAVSFQLVTISHLCAAQACGPQVTTALCVKDPYDPSPGPACHTWKDVCVKGNLTNIPPEKAIQEGPTGKIEPVAAPVASTEPPTGRPNQEYSITLDHLSREQLDAILTQLGIEARWPRLNNS